MMLSEEAIREYQEIHLQAYGEALTREQAEEYAQKMMQLFLILFEKQ